jgi:hypothetical protein
LNHHPLQPKYNTTANLLRSSTQSANSNNDNAKRTDTDTDANTDADANSKLVVADFDATAAAIVLPWTQAYSAWSARWRPVWQQTYQHLKVVGGLTPEFFVW